MKRVLLMLGMLLGVWENVRGAENPRDRAMSRARYEFLNTDCAGTDSCSLVRVSFLAEDYVVHTDGDLPYYGKRLVAEYETTTPGALTDYVFVQFIRGCVYSSFVADGLVVPVYNHSYGGEKVHNFPEWAVDSYDDNPVYGSRPGGGNFAGVKVNTVPGSYDRDTERSLPEGLPQVPVAYVTDYPSGGFSTEAGAQNSSQRFRMCMYRASDVPQTASVPADITAQPLACYEWESWFVYDHLRGVVQWPRRGQDSCPAGPFVPE
ncbi:MAG TPA: hypothetical protein VD862_02345 [Candidatus Paceibacterota bacterium]|nr:hypothetical protein [Candidatus Paceibacterota bacterium]